MGDSHSSLQKSILLSGKLSSQLLYLSNLFWVRNFIGVVFTGAKNLWKDATCIQLSAGLLQYPDYLRHYRRFHWVGISTPLPYAKWLSEVLLQDYLNHSFFKQTMQWHLQSLWTVEHTGQSTGNFTKTNFYSWELYYQRTFISLISFNPFHGVVVTTESPVISQTRQKLLVSNSSSEYQGSKFLYPPCPTTCPLPCPSSPRENCIPRSLICTFG